MSIKNVFIGSMAAFGLLLISCDEDDSSTTNKAAEPTTAEVTTAEINLSIEGLEALGDDYVYEGWILVPGEDLPVSVGVFSDPELKKQTANKAQLEKATAYVLTIEPKGETGDAAKMPADTKLFKADFEGKTATVGFATIFGADLASTENLAKEISGNFFLRTPTDEKDGDPNNGNDEAGVWFGDPGMPPSATLELPMLGAGWKYEGWAVVNGIPYSTGTFSDPKAADDNAATSKFKGAERNGPPIPGEDFINNLEGTGFSGGADLRDATIVISIEPVPDNDPKPFLLKPLAGKAGMETAPTKYAFGENLKSFPTGTVTR